MDNFTSYREAETVAKETDKKLSAYDFHCDSLVEIIHEEGTVLHYKSAFTQEWKDWIFVFTEHHGTHVYHKSDLSSWGTYIKKDREKVKGTGYRDKCEFCKKDFKVEDLNYGHHPDVDQYEESKYWIYCNDCRDIVGSDNEDLWRHLNETGAYNMEKGCTEPWGFTWGRDDMEHIKKACATVIAEEYIDRWLDTPSPSFRKTPREAIKNGNYEEVYIAVYSMGTGEFS
jgi:hypothetical protein